MPDLGNIEKISIAGAYDSYALAKIYIISSDLTLREHIHKEIFAYSSPDRYLVPLSFVLSGRAEKIPDKAVAKVVRERNYLAIVQVIDSDEPTFIACRKTGDPVQDFLGIINLMYVAVQEFDASFQDAVVDYSRSFPQKIKDFLHNVVTAAASPLLSAFPTFSSRPISFEGRNDGKVRKPKVSKEAIEDAKKDFVDNVLKYQEGDINALPKIEMVIKSMSESEKNKILADYIKTMAEEKLNSFHKKYIDNNNILNTSKITVWVRHFNDSIGNDGFYRIFYKYDDKNLKQFEFKHKESCVIFLMHLLYNRQNGDIRKSLILNNVNKNAFIHIFMKVYDITEEEAAGRYQNLLDAYDDNSNKMLAQGRLKDFIADCNKSVEGNLLPLDESPYPLKIKRNGYMPIFNSKVHFDEDALRDLQTTIV